MVMSKIKGPKTPTENHPVMLRQIVGPLFPEQDPHWSLQDSRVVLDGIPEVTTKEIINAIGANKA